MLRAQVEGLVESVLADRRLLSHPFYRRWDAGELSPGELADYAGQYRHFEAALPGVLERVAGAIPQCRARRLVQANLRDERGEPVPHLTLFDEFAAAVGASEAVEPTPATRNLVDCYRSLSDQGPVPALAALAAYEVQSSAIATSKGAGLRTHYGLDALGTGFWDVHAAVDGSHAEWTLQALADLTDDPHPVREAATIGAEAWWNFLSEREDATVAVTAEA
jgi:pyrroloquinoline-quinone synthase